MSHMRLETEFSVMGLDIAVAIFVENTNELKLNEIYQGLINVLTTAVRQVPDFSPKRSKKKEEIVNELLTETSVMGSPGTDIFIVFEKDGDSTVQELNEKALSIISDMVAAKLDVLLDEQRFAPKPYTEEALSNNLIAHIKSSCDYWNIQGCDRISALHGLAFSILATLDGSSLGMPSFIASPLKYDFDEIDEYRNYGEHWVYPFGIADIGGSLHEMYHSDTDFDSGPLKNINLYRCVLGMPLLNWSENLTEEEVKKIERITRVKYDAFQKLLG